VGDGVQLGPLGTAATNTPTVPASGDYDDGDIGGMMVWQGKPEYSEKTSPSAAVSTTNPTWSARTRTRAAAVGSQRLTAWATPRPRSRYSYWLRAGRPWCRSSSPGTIKNFLFSTSSRPTLGSTQPPVRWVLEVLSPGVKRQGREADHSPPASAEVEKLWMYTSTPPYAFTA
jgi:hypothetical protein